MAALVGLLARWRWPVSAFVLVSVSTFVGTVRDVPHDPFVAAAWTLYPVAIARGTARLSAVLSAALDAVIVSLAFLGSAQFTDTVVRMSNAARPSARSNTAAWNPSTSPL